MCNKHLWHDVGILHDFCSRSGTSNYYPTLKFVQFRSIWWRETILSWRSFNLTSVALSSRKNYLGKPIIYIRFLVEQTIGPSFSNSIEVFCFPVLGPPIALDHRISWLSSASIFIEKSESVSHHLPRFFDSSKNWLSLVC